MKRLALTLALTLAGCTVSQQPPYAASSAVAFNAPLIPWCIFACEIRTEDGTTSVLVPLDR